MLAACRQYDGRFNQDFTADSYPLCPQLFILCQHKLLIQCGSTNGAEIKHGLPLCSAGMPCSTSISLILIKKNKNIPFFTSFYHYIMMQTLAWFLPSFCCHYLKR